MLDSRNKRYISPLLDCGKKIRLARYAPTRPNTSAPAKKPKKGQNDAKRS